MPEKSFEAGRTWCDITPHRRVRVCAFTATNCKTSSACSVAMEPRLNWNTNAFGPLRCQRACRAGTCVNSDDSARHSSQTTWLTCMSQQQSQYCTLTRDEEVPTGPGVCWSEPEKASGNWHCARRREINSPLGGTRRRCLNKVCAAAMSAVLQELWELKALSGISTPPAPPLSQSDPEWHIHGLWKRGGISTEQLILLRWWDGTCRDDPVQFQFQSVPVPVPTEDFAFYR